MANANVIPFNADRFLVAVDFVSYFMKKMKPDVTTIFQDSGIDFKAKICRKFAYIAASEDMQNVLKFLYETESDLVRRDFEEFINNNMISKDSLSGFSSKYYNAYIKEGINIKNFSKYCARTAAMASYFYDTGLMNAPDLAVAYIVSSFPDDPNLNWTYLDFANDMNMNTEEISENAIQNYTRREPAGIISSETEESSNDSTRIYESDSNSNDQVEKSEGCFGTQSASSVIPSVEVESLTAQISELRVSNLDPISAVTEQIGGCCSLIEVPVTRSSSVSPRKTASARDESSPSPTKSYSGQPTKRSSSLGKRRSTGNDDSVSPYVAESAVDKDSPVKEVFSPSDPKKSKIQEVEKNE